MSPKSLATKFSIFTALRNQLNPNFIIQIGIILFGLISIVDLVPLSLSTRIIGLSLFTAELVVNYHISDWILPPFDHPKCIPIRTNWTAWFLYHFVMPVITMPVPELIFRRITFRARITYPSLIFWGAGRSGTTTFAHHLMHLKHDNVQFIGPCAPTTAPVQYRKEGTYFVAPRGWPNYKRYSTLYPMTLNPLKFFGIGLQSDSKHIIYFDGYPESHCLPFIRDRMFAINPSFKFLFFVRDPARKCLSMWSLLQDVYLQCTLKKSFTNQELHQRFRNCLDVIHSEKYQSIYRFLEDLKVNEAPETMRENIRDWLCECVLGRAMYGRDLKYWYQKFNNPQQWLILDMKSVLKDEKSIKNAVKEICKFAGAELGCEFMDNWIPTELRLNQNNIKYDPREEDMKRLEKFYEKDQREMYAFIEEKGLRFIRD